MTTMIADSTQGKTIGVVFSAALIVLPVLQPQAWKEHIGNRQVPARLALLPDSETPLGSHRCERRHSGDRHDFLPSIPLMYPEGMKTALHYNSVEIAQPITEIPVAPPPPPPAAPKVVVKKADVPPPVVDMLKLTPETAAHLPEPCSCKKLELKNVDKVDVKVPDMTPKFEAAAIEAKDNGPKRPKKM